MKLEDLDKLLNYCMCFLYYCILRSILLVCKLILQFSAGERKINSNDHPNYEWTNNDTDYDDECTG